MHLFDIVSQKITVSSNRSHMSAALSVPDSQQVFVTAPLSELQGQMQQAEQGNI